MGVVGERTAILHLKSHPENCFPLFFSGKQLVLNNPFTYTQPEYSGQDSRFFNTITDHTTYLFFAFLTHKNTHKIDVAKYNSYCYTARQKQQVTACANGSFIKSLPSAFYYSAFALAPTRSLKSCFGMQWRGALA